jgi:zinc protease
MNVTSVDLPVTKITLHNGLDVLVHEDHQLPIIAVNIWYHVGSKNEQPGRTGFAHLFEHLMFEGSEHCSTGYFSPLQQAGASVNGSTNADRTNYWEVVPSNAIDLALWLESDRMGHLLPALTQERFETQRAVVLNERRQNYENRPYGLAIAAVMESLFPPEHPYHWLTIGAVDDLYAMQLDEVQNFFRTYYHPANASLSLAGNIDTDTAFKLAEQYFGDIPTGPSPQRPIVKTALSSEVRLVLEDRVEMPRVYMAWHSPAMFAKGDAEMDLISDLLANGKASRLYRVLVYERRIALDVSAFQSSLEIGGFFLLVATGLAGTPLTSLVFAIDEIIDEVCQEGPRVSELKRAQAQTEAHFVYRLQTVGGFGGKSDQLNAYNVFRQDPEFFSADLHRYQAATSDSVRQAVSQVLIPNQRVILSVVPHEQGQLALTNSEPVSVS